MGLVVLAEEWMSESTFDSDSLGWLSWASLLVLISWRALLDYPLGFLSWVPLQGCFGFASSSCLGSRAGVIEKNQNFIKILQGLDFKSQ